MKIYLFTTSTCSKCLAVEELLNNNDVDYTEFIIDEDDYSRDMAAKYNIMSVPIVIKVFDDGTFRQLSAFDLKK